MQGRPRLDSLTGMRFAAAFAVFGFHLEGTFYFTTPLSATSHPFLAGPTGVSFFFILSGFVLTWSHRPGDASLAFYRRRLARIGPLHVATWALMLVTLAAIAELPGPGATAASLGLVVPWIPQYTHIPPVNSPSWSLGCELFFYLLFPVLLWGLLRLRRRGRLGLAVALALGVLLVAVAARPDQPDTLRAWGLYYFPPVRLLEFVLGMVLALEVAEGRLPRVPLRAAGALALGAFVADTWAPRSFEPVAVTLVPLTLLIVAGAQADIAGARSWWRSPAMVRLGTWSFALYMVHDFVLTVLFRLFHGPMGVAATVAVGLVALGASLGLAAAAYRFVEHPLERRLRPGGRARRADPGPAPVPGVRTDPAPAPAGALPMAAPMAGLGPRPPGQP